MLRVESWFAGLWISDGSKVLDEAFVGNDTSDDRVGVSSIPVDKKISTQNVTVAGAELAHTFPPRKHPVQ